MNAALSPLIEYWKQRNSREQLILLFGAGILLLALLYSVVIYPIATDRARLEKSLPALRADTARFGRDLALATGKNSGQKTDLAGLATAAGLPKDALRLNGSKQASLHAKATAWPTITKLLADAQTQGWALKMLQVNSPDGDATVDVDVEWQR
ncbi:type II secretion system protein GspM [Chitinimonas sp. BJB300]|uniref:type II secretion system protein GspM n=1 Tax=Chitinimonas sp. BJB300 TaxID=1559339 RepID=UPI000C0E2BA6|nr:type II secretion system protein GspM [Chitinimonas sp. BJB300]PHV12150.1 hypothetical protein CSQ89_07210 [Chitinimonas sp. BJB300]TSJ90118.1 type II secretion system protein M [Chitinimonas sp. BJB300]